MAYHVTILRTDAGRQSPIRESDVRAAVARMAGRLAIVRKDEELWVCRPELGDDSEILILGGDELWAGNPSEQFFALVNELAGQLGARVRGDEGESYTADGDAYCHVDDWASHREHFARSRPRLITAGLVWNVLTKGVPAVILLFLVYKHLSAS